ncbi:uncharacterized protein LOC113302174 isoform X2 [Papaver somniferum]|nr:uncharacterized protein LOC113302174 isoform X2 [Papaver somniferum]
MSNEFMDLRRTWNQINSTPNVPSFVPSETYDNVFRPVPDLTYDLSPIQWEETWSKEPIVSSSGKRVNIKKLFRQYEQLEEEGATEEILQTISRAIHDEVNRHVDMEKSPKKKIPRMMNPWKMLIMKVLLAQLMIIMIILIQKEEVESKNTKVINDKTYVVCESDDDYDFFVNNTLNSEIVNTLNEKSICDEAHKDYDNLLMEDSDFFSDEEDLDIEETDEELLVKSLNDNCDSCDVGESMDFFRSTEDPVMREIMRGLSNPSHESPSNDDPPKLEVVSQRVVNTSFRKIPHLGWNYVLLKFFPNFLFPSIHHMY